MQSTFTPILLGVGIAHLLHRQKTHLIAEKIAGFRGAPIVFGQPRVTQEGDTERRAMGREGVHRLGSDQWEKARRRAGPQVTDLLCPGYFDSEASMPWT